MADFIISGSESGVNLTDENLQVPSPPVPESVQELEVQLSEVQALYNDLKKGFGNTTTVTFANSVQFDAAKANAYKLLKTTIPGKIKQRRKWEKDYSVRRGQIFGEDTVVLTAQEVYDIQTQFKAANNPNDKELKAYDSAVSAVQELQKRIDTPGTYESGLAKSEQQLLIATALKKVQSTVTPKVEKLRGSNIPVVVDEYGRTMSQTNFYPVTRVASSLDTALETSVSEADKELSTVVPDKVDRYGRVLTNTTIRDEEQSRQFAAFQDRAKKVKAGTVKQAEELTAQQPRTAAQELRGGVQDVTPAKPTVTMNASGQPVKTVATPVSAAAERLGGTSKVVPAPITTPTPTGGGGGGGGGSRTPAPARPSRVSPDAWKDILRQTFPAYSNDWLTDNAAAHFGQDVIDLMIEAAKPNGKFGGLKTDEGKAAYDRALRQTSYFLNTTSNARAFDQSTPGNQQTLVNQKKLQITEELGDLGFDEATLNKLAFDMARKGLTGLGLTQAIYATVLKPAGAPADVAVRAMESADADRIKAIGRAYNYSVNDDELKSILTGQPTASGIVLTEEGLRQKAQNWAKGAMPQLADQIDSGVSLSDIAGNYRRYASQILETTEDQIDMFSGPYLQAFGTKDTGQLSLGDWVERLKSDPRFGWQYTKQANQQATDVALSIARAFGKVQ